MDFNKLVGHSTRFSNKLLCITREREATPQHPDRRDSFLSEPIPCPYTRGWASGSIIFFRNTKYVDRWEIRTSKCPPRYMSKNTTVKKLRRSVQSGGRLTDAAKGWRSLFCRGSLPCKAKNPRIMQHQRTLQNSNYQGKTQTHRNTCTKTHGNTTHQKM